MNYTNKIIGIWGYGRVGKAAAQFLQSQGAFILIYDEKPINVPPTMHVVHSLKELFQSEYLLPSPGVDTRAHRMQYQGTWLCELDLFYEHFHKPIIAITGSVGKTTVTHLLTQALVAAGWRVQAAGNIGVACLDMVEQQHDLDAVVLEISSFQLEYAQLFAPALAIWTTFYPNHLDRHATMQDYFNAKYNLIRYQTKQQSALVPVDLLPSLQERFPQSSLSFFGSSTGSFPYPLFTIEQGEIRLQSPHGIRSLISLRNLDTAIFPLNWLIVYAAVSLLDVSPSALSTIQPIAHRLEHVATINGIMFYNDSKATTPASTHAALSALTAPRTILFLGGLSKGIDRTPLIQSLCDKPIQVICFGKEAEQLHAQCVASHIPSHIAATLEEAFAHCVSIAKPNDCVLFSPSGSSFDLFENYEKRGDEFKALVLRYSQRVTIS